MQYLLLFIEGIITFISPCILPMLPVYVSYFAAGEFDKKQTLKNSLGFVLGFTIIFVTLGAFAGSVGKLVREHTVIVNIITGSIVIILGLNFIGALKINFLNRTNTRNVNTKNLSFLTSIIFGIVFSIGWTPCVGAFLGSALMLASQSGEIMYGFTMLLVYSLGLGVPFIISAILIDSLKDAFNFIKKNYKIINFISGSLLVVVGILMATGYMGWLLSFLSF